MKIRKIILFLLIVPFACNSEEKPTIYDFEYGVFSSGSENYEEGNKVLSSDGDLIKTEIVHAQLGTKFGLRYWLSRKGFEFEPTLHLIYLVPTMVNPSTGERIDKIEILQAESKLDYKHTMAFEFAQPFELVPGEYRFYVFYENQKLLEKVFQVKLK